MCAVAIAIRFRYQCTNESDEGLLRRKAPPILPLRLPVCFKDFTVCAHSSAPANALKSRALVVD